MEASIGNIWTALGRVPVRVLDMVPSSHTVWSIFRKGNSEDIQMCK